VRRTDATDKVKERPGEHEGSPGKPGQDHPAEAGAAGYRNKELAVFVIFARMVLPIVLGFIAWW
jgi:tight adherence protein C